MVYVTPGEDYDVRSFLPNLPLAAVTDRLIHPASHRYRRRDLPGARRRRSRPDLSGGPRYAWQPARPEDSQDQSQGLVGRCGQARAVRNRGDTRRASAQVYAQARAQVRGNTSKFRAFCRCRRAIISLGNKLVPSCEGVADDFGPIQVTDFKLAVGATVPYPPRCCGLCYARVVSESRRSLPSAMSTPMLLDCIVHLVSFFKRILTIFIWPPFISALLQ